MHQLSTDVSAARRYDSHLLAAQHGMAMGFSAIWASAVVVLAALLASAVILPAPWNWLLAMMWMGYDTWLQAHHLYRGRLAINRVAPGTATRVGPTISILVAAHNEVESILDCLANLPVSETDEVLVVDDGSDDGTAELVRTVHHLSWIRSGEEAARPGCPIRLLVVPRGGKARALNCALQRCHGEVVMTIDADTRLRPGSLEAMRQAFAADSRLGAACAVIEPVCVGGMTARISGFFQAREYARAFVWRAGWAADGMLVLVSGACAAYQRQALIAVGGFDATSLVEDYEVMYRLNHRQPGFRAGVVAGARAVTDAPAGVRTFLRQRSRWFGGFLATLVHYRDMVGDARYSALGRWHLRLKTMDMLLPLYGLAALVVFVALWAVHGPPPSLVIAVLVTKVLVDAALHVAAERVYRRWLGLSHMSLWAWPASVAEQCCFQPLRQFGAVLGWWVYLARAARGGMW
jgi:cellulose synthase/poly-beta-1,6-N-acetylglucosamine synthase-like glycosyltransferase